MFCPILDEFDSAAQIWTPWTGKEGQVKEKFKFLYSTFSPSTFPEYQFPHCGDIFSFFTIHAALQTVALFFFVFPRSI